MTNDVTAHKILQAIESLRTIYPTLVDADECIEHVANETEWGFERNDDAQTGSRRIREAMHRVRCIEHELQWLAHLLNPSESASAAPLMDALHAVGGAR